MICDFFGSRTDVMLITNSFTCVLVLIYPCFSTQCICCGVHRSLQVPSKGRDIDFFCWNHNLLLIFCCDFTGEPKLLYKAEFSAAWPFFPPFSFLWIIPQLDHHLCWPAVDLGVFSFQMCAHLDIKHTGFPCNKSTPCLCWVLAKQWFWSFVPLGSCHSLNTLSDLLI